jgi:hypothetical protein
MQVYSVTEGYLAWLMMSKFSHVYSSLYNNITSLSKELFSRKKQS